MSGAPLGRALPGRVGWRSAPSVQGGLRILEKIERAALRRVPAAAPRAALVARLARMLLRAAAAS